MARRNSLKYVGLVVLLVFATACGTESQTAPQASVPDGSTEVTGSQPGLTTATSSPTSTKQEGSALNSLLPERIREAGVMTSATSGAFPPNNFVGEDDAVIGIAPDIIDAMGEELGIEFEYVVTDFSSILVGIDAGRFDSGMIFTDTLERQQQAEMFSIYQGGQHFLVQAAYEGPETPECGSRIAIPAGSIEEVLVPQMSEELCESQGQPAYELQTYPNNEAATVALVSGRVDAFLTGATNAIYRASQADDLKPLGELIHPGLYAVALPKGDDQLVDVFSAALQAIMDSGRYQEILDSWGAGDLSLDEPVVNGAAE